MGSGPASSGQIDILPHNPGFVGLLYVRHILCASCRLGQHSFLAPGVFLLPVESAPFHVEAFHIVFVIVAALDRLDSCVIACMQCCLIDLLLDVAIYDTHDVHARLGCAWSAAQ